MGVDSIPTIYDASVSGFLPTEYQSGVGYGNQLYMRDLTEVTPGAPYPPDSIPSGYMWVPEVQGGYLYIGQDEYYLYANKVTITGTPSGGKLELGEYTDKFPPLGAPIIVTLGDSEFGVDEPFGRVYEPTPSGADPRTPTKYRKRVDLTGRKEWRLDASGFIVPYSFSLGNMEFTIDASGNHPTSPSGWYRYIECYPSGDAITVEMEDGPSGYLTIPGVDFNILNTLECQNAFLAVAVSGSLIPSTIYVDYASRHLPAASQNIMVIVAVKDMWGAPVSGVSVTMSDGGAGGTFSNSTSTTEWDGTASTWYTTPVATSAGATVTATYGVINGQTWIPIGK